ncbi:protein kinase family protein [Actinidia rufa]|uniref:Protein kinase family protein n=1 Tax=Actinidia rufa TaxID=165716 RepID=A0A7J0EAI1_9ERIC|nr:protein kinase family protein [Actinidia rufa]
MQIGAVSCLLNYAADSCNKSCSSRGPFVYGFIDLFSGSGESWHWGLEVEDTHGINHSVHSHTQDGSNHGYVLENKNVQNVKPTMTQEVKQVPLLAPIKKLDTLEEESEDDSKNISASDLSRSLSGESVGTGMVAEAEILGLDNLASLPGGKKQPNKVVKHGGSNCSIYIAADKV